jgi:hypothetical protein
MLDTLQKHSIKNNIENIGFLEKTTKNADNKHVLEKIINKLLLTILC